MSCEEKLMGLSVIGAGLGRTGTPFSPQLRQSLTSSPVGSCLEKTVWARYGDRIDDRTFTTAEFERHVAEVERSIPPERLLVYRVGEGWDRLSEFLGVPVPTRPFPRTRGCSGVLHPGLGLTRA